MVSLSPHSFQAACGNRVYTLVKSNMSPDTPLTFSEALRFYFESGNELYAAKARGDNTAMTKALQGFVDSLREELTKTADGEGAGKKLRSALRDEQTLETRALWLRTSANKLKAARPGLLSLELIGSAGVVVAVSYYVVHVDASLALLLGLVLIALRLSLPWMLDVLSTHEERGLRELRRIDSHKPR